MKIRDEDHFKTEKKFALSENIQSSSEEIRDANYYKAEKVCVRESLRSGKLFVREKVRCEN